MSSRAELNPEEMPFNCIISAGEVRFVPENELHSAPKDAKLLSAVPHISLEDKKRSAGDAPRALSRSPISLEQKRSSTTPSIILRVAPNSKVETPFSDDAYLTQKSPSRLTNKPPSREVKENLPFRSPRVLILEEDIENKDSDFVTIDVKPSLRTPLLSPAADLSDEVKRSLPTGADSSHSSTRITPIDAVAVPIMISLTFNALLELTDALDRVQDKLSLFPCPGKPDFLAVIPNSSASQAAIIVINSAYTLVFDLPNLSHGLREVAESISLRSIPGAWKREWAKQDLPESKLRWIVGICFVISALSIYAEILNSLSMSDDNAQEASSEERDSKIAPWLRTLTSCKEWNQISAYLGNAGYFFTEAYMFPKVVVKTYLKQRGAAKIHKTHPDKDFGEEYTEITPYSKTLEYLSLILTRGPGAIGSLLFALATVTKKYQSIPAQVAFGILVCFPKGLTSLAYDGEYHMEFWNDLVNVLRNIQQGVYSFGRGFIDATVLVAAGIVAYLQQVLTEDYLNELNSSNNPILHQFLMACAYLYALEMMGNYSKSFKYALDVTCDKIAAKCSHHPESVDDNKAEAKEPENPAPFVPTQLSRQISPPSRLSRLGRWFADKAGAVRRACCGRRPAEMPDENNEATHEYKRVPSSPTVSTTRSSLSDSRAAATHIPKAGEVVAHESKRATSPKEPTEGPSPAKSIHRLLDQAAAAETKTPHAIVVISEKPKPELPAAASSSVPKISAYEAGVTHFKTSHVGSTSTLPKAQCSSTHSYQKKF